MIESQNFLNKIKTAGKILIITHVSPDGDALGGAGALYFYLKNHLNKDVNIFCATAVPENYNFLSLPEFIGDKNELNLKDFDLIITTDCADIRRTGIAEEINAMRDELFIINIDHHATNPGFGDINIIKIVSSTCEIVFQLLKKLNTELTPLIANALLTGISTDTSFFSNAATSSESIEASSHLLTQGAQIKQIINNTWKNQSVDSLKVWGKILSNLHFNKKYQVVVAIIHENEDTNAEIYEGLANFLTVLYEAKIIMVLRQAEENKIKASLRTVRDTVNVSTWAKAFGGGGHAKAAGFSINGRLHREEERWRIK